MILRPALAASVTALRAPRSAHQEVGKERGKKRLLTVRDLGSRLVLGNDVGVLEGQVDLDLLHIRVSTCRSSEAAYSVSGRLSGGV